MKSRRISQIVSVPEPPKQKVLLLHPVSPTTYFCVPGMSAPYPFPCGPFTLHKKIFKQKLNTSIRFGYTTPCYIFFSHPPPYVSHYLLRNPRVQIARLITPTEINAEAYRFVELWPNAKKESGSSVVLDAQLHRQCIQSLSVPLPV